jgi:hypothetical protein
MLHDKLNQSYRFDSLYEFATYVKETPQAKGSGNSSHKDSPGNDWDLGVGWDGAVALASTGWSEGREKIQALTIQATAEGYANRDNMVYDVVGFRPCVPSYCAGEMEHMMQPAETPDRPMITILANFCASYGIRSNAFYNYGTALLSLINTYESQGVSVELEGIWAGKKYNGKPFEFVVSAKRCDQPLNLDELAFVFSHPAMLRRLGFKLMETDKTFNKETKGGYASIRKTPTDRADIAIDFDYDACDTLKGAIEDVTKQAETAK